MTPPSKPIHGVEVNSAHSLNLEIFNAWQPGKYTQYDPENKKDRQIARMLDQATQNSDLKFDPKGVQFKQVKDGSILSIDHEAKYLAWIRHADADHDAILTTEEVAENPWTEFSQGICLKPLSDQEVQESLQEVEQLMATRYRPLLQNMNAWKTTLGFQPTLDLLRTYNQGLLLEDQRQSHSFLSPNNLVKAPVNILGALSATVHNNITRHIFDGARGEAVPYLYGDYAAENYYTVKFQERETALDHLELVIHQGARMKTFQEIFEEAGLIPLQNQHEGPGAPKLSMDQALAMILMESEQYQEMAESAQAAGDKNAAEGNTELAEEWKRSYEILTSELPVRQIHKILSQDDPQAVYGDLLAFADGERPAYMGMFGGGNTNSSDWFNLSGTRNNFYAASSLYNFLTNNALTGDVDYDNSLANRAIQSLNDMTGVEGSVSSALWYLKDLVTPGEAHWRDWGDLATLELPGRAIGLGLSSFVGFRAQKAYSRFLKKTYPKPLLNWQKPLERWQKIFMGGNIAVISDFSLEKGFLPSNRVARASMERTSLTQSHNAYNTDLDLDVRPWKDPTQAPPAE